MLHPVAEVFGDNREANAALIVRAVNRDHHFDALVKALEECAARCRYDGDLFHEQGNIQRRDASWRAQENAEVVLAAAGGSR